MAARILIVDDELSIRALFVNYLGRFQYDVQSASSFGEGLEKAISFSPELVCADIRLGNKTGVDLLRALRQEGIDCPVILITGHPDMESATQAIQAGAHDYLIKPVQLDHFLKVVKNALLQHGLKVENEAIRSNLQAVFQSVQDAILTVDESFRLLELNNAAEELLGFSRKEVLGRPFPPPGEDSLRDRCRDVLARTMAEKGPVVVERAECLDRQGRGRTLNLRAVPLRREGNRFSGGVLVVRDDTRLASLETALDQRMRFHRLQGKSRAMREVYSLLEKLVDTHTTVLITGESGTGKELAAEALHYPRPDARTAPMVKVNCAALPDSLLESELFGHVKGAFTGAIQNKLGRFEMANGGTLFLDEIGDISAQMQLRLLRAIQEREFERVGDPRPIKVNFRLIAATNQDLKKKVREGTFREDLYYRLKVVVVRLPPLRERKEDIPLLVRTFLEKFSQELGKPLTSLTHEAENALMAHNWPGNVRELEHTIEHACIVAPGDPIGVAHLPPDLFSVVLPPRPVSETVPPPPIAPEGGDRELLRVLEACRWNKSKAAQVLGVNRRTLYRRMERIWGASQPPEEG